MRGQSLLAGVGLVLLLSACGGGSDVTSPTNSGPNTVTVGNNFYSPGSLTVPVNTTVTWAWASGATTHTVTFDGGGPTSPQQSSGTFEHAFGTPGTYTYFCQIHGANVMHGTVVVTGAGTGGSGGGGMGGGGTGGGGTGGGGAGY